jgi:hypothetical protein
VVTFRTPGWMHPYWLNDSGRRVINDCGKNQYKNKQYTNKIDKWIIEQN